MIEKSKRYHLAGLLTLELGDEPMIDLDFDGCDGDDDVGVALPIRFVVPAGHQLASKVLTPKSRGELSILVQPTIQYACQGRNRRVRLVRPCRT